MKRILALFFLMAITFFYSCKNAGSSEDQVYAQQKESLAKKEQKNPVNFLQIAGDDRRNLFGQTVVKGTIINKATVTGYKNIRVKMLFYNKAGTLVANHEDVYEKLLPAGQSMKFKARYGTPKGTDSVALSVMSALPAEKK